MFTKKTSIETTDVDKEINRVYKLMADQAPSADEYAAMLDQLAKLHKLKETETKKHVSPDTWVAAAASIISVLIIVGYEHAHVIGSKSALSFVMKAK